MKVLCVGFWKTGTKSLAEALRILGYKVYDYDDQFFAFPELWNNFRKGTVTDAEIRETLKDVDVIIDGPVIAYWDEIHRAIPEAKVILTTRDEDSWFESYRGMTKKAPWWMRVMFSFFLLTPAGFRFVQNAATIVRLCLGVEGPLRLPMITCIPNNSRLYKMQFRKHNCHVLQSVPEDQLLQHEAKNGWEHLCKFLGKEVPDVPYPHKNKLGAHHTEEGGPQHPEFKNLQRQGIVAFSVIVALFAYALYIFITFLFN